MNFKIFVDSMLTSFTDVLVQTTISISAYIFYILLFPVIFTVGILKNKRFENPKNIIITGASSGIGREFALQYATKGRKLYLTGRNKERLDEVVELCLKKGAKVESTTIDVTDRDNLKVWLENADRATPIDLVIANAGISEATLPKTMTYEEKIYEVNNVNVNGVMNTVVPLIPAFRERKNGQIVITGSMASQLPVVFPAYVASKYWVLGWASSMRQELRSYGIGVTVLIPAFVKTRMSDAVDIDKFLEKTPEQSVKIFISDIAENKAFSCDNKPTLTIMSFINKISPNLYDGWTLIQNKLYPDGNIDSYTFSSGYKKNL